MVFPKIQDGYDAGTCFGSCDKEVSSRQQEYRASPGPLHGSCRSRNAHDSRIRNYLELPAGAERAYELGGVRSKRSGWASLENRDGWGRYPLRVRILYPFAWSPISFTLIARQPELGLAFG